VDTPFGQQLHITAFMWTFAETVQLQRTVKRVVLAVTGHMWQAEGVRGWLPRASEAWRMDPSCVACPNLACPDKGAVGGGNIRVHARAEGRYRCRACRRTCAATTNTPLYRLHHPAATMTLVLTLLIHG